MQVQGRSPTGQLLDLRPHDRRVNGHLRRRDQREFIGTNVFRFLVLLLLLVIVLQLTEVIGQLQAWAELFR